MAWSNFVLTLVGLGSVVYLMKSDVRHGSIMLKRNMKTIRAWLEEEGGSKTIGALPKPSEVKKPEGPSSTSQ